MATAAEFRERVIMGQVSRSRWWLEQVLPGLDFGQWTAFPRAPYHHRHADGDSGNENDDRPAMARALTPARRRLERLAGRKPPASRTLCGERRPFYRWGKCGAERLGKRPRVGGAAWQGAVPTQARGSGAHILLS